MTAIIMIIIAINYRTLLQIYMGSLRYESYPDPFTEVQTPRPTRYTPHQDIPGTGNKVSMMALHYS